MLTRAFEMKLQCIHTRCLHKRQLEMNTSVKAPPSVFTLPMKAGDLECLVVFKDLIQFLKHILALIILHRTGIQWDIGATKSTDFNYFHQCYRIESMGFYWQIWSLLWLLKFYDSQ